MCARIEKTTIIQPSFIPGKTQKVDLFAIIKADGEVYSYAKTEDRAQKLLAEHLEDIRLAASMRDHMGF